MTIEINLLPWRLLKRKQEKKALIVLLLTSLSVGFVVIFLINYYVESLINYQGHRNSRLQEESDLFKRQINDIKTLHGMCQLLNARMTSIHGLQQNRALIVHLFDELVNIVPDGVYLTYVKRDGAQIKIFGRAKTNHAISRMMRRIELNPWFHKPKLTEIKKNKIHAHSAANEFKLSFVVTNKG
ncbi:MAG: hypothetical protein A3F46_01000 [Legionellales bacterium RIFCSPHIGHO2_12_FULL_42_9]|nr:MAG: hypothetical protein A3F46_01000 [Legionellales bacterium RIFCSPHIGHO2_12_FULL_42_9]